MSLGDSKVDVLQGFRCVIQGRSVLMTISVFGSAGLGKLKHNQNGIFQWLADVSEYMHRANMWSLKGAISA